MVALKVKTNAAHGCNTPNVPCATPHTVGQPRRSATKARFKLPAKLFKFT
jgi:hypothetical protein